MDEQGTATRLGLNPRAALFVLLVFSLSRLLVFGAMATSSLVLPRSQVAGWDLDNPILRPLFRWDTGWYLSIATTTLQAGVAFWLLRREFSKRLAPLERKASPEPMAAE